MKIALLKSRSALVFVIQYLGQLLRQIFTTKLNFQLLAVGVIPLVISLEFLEIKLPSSAFFFSPREKTSTSYNFSTTPSWYRSTSLISSGSLSRKELENALLAGIPRGFRKRAALYVKDILKYSELYQVDPLLVMSIAWTESHFRKWAKSHMNAIGIMQVLPTTGVYLHKKRYGFFPYRNRIVALRDPSINIELGTYYLKKLIKSFHSTKLAIVSYNMGPARIRYRLKKNRPVGTNNQYLRKVRRAYLALQKSYLEAIRLKKTMAFVQSPKY